MPRSQSQIWKHFVRCEGLNKVAVCKYCTNTFSYKGSSGNLKAHLKRRHHSVYSNLKDILSANSKTEGRCEVTSSSISGSGQKTYLRQHRKKSEIWNHFKMCEKGKEATCNYCTMITSYKGSTSRMFDHIRQNHKKIWNGIRVKKQQWHKYATHRQHFDKLTGIDRATDVDKNIDDDDDDEYNRSYLLWNHFQKLPGDERAVCKHCKLDYSYKGVSGNLKAHLKSKHPSEYLKLTSANENEGEKNDDDGDEGENEDDDVFASNDSDGDTTANSLQSLTPAESSRIILQHKPRSDHKNVMIDKCLVKLIAYDFQLLTIVEDKGFKEFVHSLNPAYDLPSKEIIASTLLPTLYEERWEYFVNFVTENAESVCLTVNSWSSRTEHYLGVTAHFFTEDLEMKSVLLQCDMLDVSLAGTGIVQELKTVVEAWRISDKIILLVTDDASNICNARDIFNWDHFGCFASKLNSTVQHALNTVEKIIEKVTKIVIYIKNNSAAKEKLMEHQFGNQNIENPRTVIKAIPTRWNSIYLMLERFHYLKEAIQAVVSTQDDFLPIISDEEWACIQQICMILKPFHEVSNVMSEENYLTGSTATILSSNLMKICASLSLKSGFYTPVTDLLEKLKQGLTQKLGDIQHNLNMTLCTLLDPRYKEVAFSDTLSLDQTKRYALSLIKSSFDDDTAAVDGEEPLENSVVDSLSIWDMIDSKLTSTNVPKTAESKAREELDLFLKEAVINRKLCPLTWWRDHKGVYPALYRTFKTKCNIVVTSIPCKQVFSKVGYILNNRKTCLNTSKVPEIMFLNANNIV